MGDPTTVPLVIEFASRTRLHRERDRVSQLPIHRNGPPGTFVVFPDGLRVSLPTDQIVFADDRAGRVRVGFGGMRFTGVEAGRLTFQRERELFPDVLLSPDRSHRMLLETFMVASIHGHGELLWSGPAGQDEASG